MNTNALKQYAPRARQDFIAAVMARAATYGLTADHVEPIKRYKDFKITDKGVEHFNTCEKPHLDTIDNMVPACKKCNLFEILDENSLCYF